MKTERMLERYNHLEQREKIAVIGMGLALLLFVFYLLVFNPLQQRLAQSQLELTQLQQQQTQIAAELELYLGLNQIDPDAHVKQVKTALEKQLQALEAKLQSISGGLMLASKLPSMLQDVARHRQGVALQSLETLPVETMALVEGKGMVKVNAKTQALSTTNADENTKSKTENNEEIHALIYRQGVEVQLTGSYFQLKDYLQTLENLPWKFYWESLDFSVLEYPRSQLQLHVYTLSTEQGAFSE